MAFISWKMSYCPNRSIIFRQYGPRDAFKGISSSRRSFIGSRNTRIGRPCHPVVLAAMSRKRESQSLGDEPTLNDLCVNTIRMLVVDSVNNSQAGHPGAAMGLAPLGFVLFSSVMKFNPRNPDWFNRDRFVLSVGHAVLLQYILLHLTGYDLEMNDIRRLATLGSMTPGHPENVITPGIELTTGPLGQGFANAIGIAIAEKHLASRFNKPGCNLVDHYTYCILGDGCIMEGITNEAASLAGHLGLGKLIAFYDDNKNTIDGSTHLTLSEDVAGRYRALGWHVQTIPKSLYGDRMALQDAILQAKIEEEKPSLVIIETIIGFGSPSKQGTHKAHHGVFSDDEVSKIRANLGWIHEEPFFVPVEVRHELLKAVSRGASAEEEWKQTLQKYKKEYPEESSLFLRLMSNEMPPNWIQQLPNWSPNDAPDATRGFSEKVLNTLAHVFIGLIGGSADLASSNKAYLHACGDFQKETPGGRNIRYGVREHAMGAISIGIALHSNTLIPFAATFLVFTDYMRPAIRLSAISEARVIWVASHDSIGLGEDGPTHQPIEHLASLRAMPNLNVFRPGDGVETSAAYVAAVQRKNGPTLIALSRQKLEAQLEGSSIDGSLKGGYILSDNSSSNQLPEIILMGTGSELVLCQSAAQVLRKEGIRVRLVSMVCWELFRMQEEDYIHSVLPSNVNCRLSVEAASPQGWREWTGPDGMVIGIDRFGKSGQYLDVFREYGFTVANIVKQSQKLIARNSSRP